MNFCVMCRYRFCWKEFHVFDFVFDKFFHVKTNENQSFFIFECNPFQTLNIFFFSKFYFHCNITITVMYNSSTIWIDFIIINIIMKTTFRYIIKCNYTYDILYFIFSWKIVMIRNNTILLVVTFEYNNTLKYYIDIICFLINNMIFFHWF